MAYDPTDGVMALELLEDALALTSEPTLTPDQVDRALALAASVDDDGITVIYPADGLNRAAAWGWGIKAGLTADRYDLGGGAGKTLDESQWHAHCKAMQRDYASGAISVVGATTRRRGIGSIRTITRPEESGVPS